MFDVKKEMKRMEARQEAQNQLNGLISTEKSIDKMIDEFYTDARERLLENDETGFELIANSIFYFQDIKKIVQTIRVQFQTYVKTAQFIDTIGGIRPVLRKADEITDSMPRISRNNKDMMKFKKGLTKGQLNIKSLSSMMNAVNPATASTRSKEEMDALKERLLVDIGANNAQRNNQKKSGDNEDFFAAINQD